jgi:CHASE3 domain sensor protein
LLPKSNSINQVDRSPSGSLEADAEEPASQSQPTAEEQEADAEEPASQSQLTAEEQEPDLDSEDASSPASEVQRAAATQPSAFAAVPAPSSLHEERERDRMDWYARRAYQARRALQRSTLIGSAALILGAGALAAIMTLPNTSNKSMRVIVTCVSVALIVLYCGQVFLRSRSFLKRTRPILESIDQPLSSDKRADGQRRTDIPSVRGPDDARTNNQLLIDRYHQLTTQQAATSYRNSQIAMAAGLALLVIGAVVAINTTSGSAQLVVGGLTALGTALSAYLGATFIRTYERALLQMNYYFGQPLVTSYILEAERLSGKLSKAKRDNALSAIISETLLGASNASRALSPGPEDQMDKRGNRTRRRIAEDDAKTTGSQ